MTLFRWDDTSTVHCWMYTGTLASAGLSAVVARDAFRGPESFFLKRFTSAWRTAHRAPSRPPGILRTPTRQYTRGRRLSCPSPGTPRENCAYVPARTQTRAAPFRAVPMCVCPVLAPHGRPAPPAPAARPSHHQRQPHIHSRRDARAAAHLTSTPAPFCALCRLCRLLLASHKRLY